MDWHTTPEGREALSLAHSSEAVCILRLSNGTFAIYNDIKRLQQIATREEVIAMLDSWPPFPPRQGPERLSAKDLADLGIL